MSAVGRGGIYRDGGAYFTPPALAHAIVGVVADEWRGSTILEPQVGGGGFLQALYSHGLAGPGLVEVMDLNPEARGFAMPGPHQRTTAIRTDDPVQTGFLVTDPDRRPAAVVGNPPFGVPRPPEPCKRCQGIGSVLVTRRQRKLVARGHIVGGRAVCPTCKGSRIRTFDRPLPTAQLHVERALDVADRWVLQLLRLAMLESDERLEMWRGTPLREVHIIPRRPDFMKVCGACCGTRVEAVPGCWVPPTCQACNGTGEAQGRTTSGDSAAYAAFLWDHHHRGDPAVKWLPW